MTLQAYKMLTTEKFSVVGGTIDVERQRRACTHHSSLDRACMRQLPTLYQ